MKWQRWILKKMCWRREFFQVE